MIGQVVLSKAGRDSGKHFVVIEIVNEDYVLVADGKYHKVDKPKKKKWKHLVIKPFNLEQVYGKIKGTEFLQDKKLREAIEMYVKDSNQGGIR